MPQKSVRANSLSPEDIRRVLPSEGLFRGGIPWLLSPKPLALNKKQVKFLLGLGGILERFYEAAHAIYGASMQGKKNNWLAPLLNQGKPQWLVDCQCSCALQQCVPAVIRPDLIMMEDGWKLTELDSVPGGQGVTAFLSRLYGEAGWNILGGPNGMVEGFRHAHPDGADIIVSQESADYREEMNYFARLLGKGYACLPAEHYVAGKTPCVYRFFELFDTDQIPGSRELLEAAAAGQLRLSPPPVPHLEEKLWLALFHLPGLQGEWKSALRRSHWERLLAIIPHGWVVDPAPLPPQACLPWLNVHGWNEVALMSQKQRRLVLKISGFHPLAWGARGVMIGHDMASGEWAAALKNALEQFGSSPWILQEFHDGQIVQHPYYDRNSDELKIMNGRVRLCPYYYRNAANRVALGGALATIVPSDKKKIHGMKDAILVPCCLP